MRIYISGPISGRDKEKVTKQFKETADLLTMKGCRVFNPLENGLPFDDTTHHHMRRDLNVLTNEEDPFDYIYMMEHWTHSAGCWKELETAISCGIGVIFEEASIRNGLHVIDHKVAVQFG